VLEAITLETQGFALFYLLVLPFRFDFLLFFFGGGVVGLLNTPRSMCAAYPLLVGAALAGV